MPLEKQVSSLEPSKRLKELRVKQESLFVWVQDVAGPSYVCHMPEDGLASRSFLKSEHNYPTLYKNYSAFTVAELGEMLPDKPYEYTSKKVNGMWECAKRSVHGNGMEQYANTEADARAKCLIYLIENNLITL